MSSSNKPYAKLISHPTETPIPLPRPPGFTSRGLNPSSTAIPSRDAPVSTSRIHSLTHGRPCPSVISTSNHDRSAGRGDRGILSPSASGTRGSQVNPPRRNAPGIAVMLSSPATPHQYEGVDEPDDELQAADKCPLSDQGPQSRSKAMVAPGEHHDRATLANPLTSKTVTPISLPGTATLPVGTSTPQPRSGASTPGSKSGKMGRPKGWRPGMAYGDVRTYGAEIAGKMAAERAARDPAGTHERARTQRAAAPRPGTQGIRKRGRPPQAPSPSPIDIYRAAGIKCVPFPCEWRGCEIELHNLQTLERHVYVVHCREKVRGCRWATCAEVGLTFDTVEELKVHVREVHFIPCLWHMGEGPMISVPPPPLLPPSPDDDEEEEEEKGGLPSYLFNEDGEQVTQSIRGQKVESEETRKRRKKQREEAQRKVDQAMLLVDESEEEFEPRQPLWGVA